MTRGRRHERHSPRTRDAATVNLIVAGPHAVGIAIDQDDRSGRITRVRVQVRRVCVERSAEGAGTSRRLNEILERSSRAGIPVEQVPRGQADRLAGTRTQGICAEVAISYAQLRDLLEADVLGKDARGSRLLVFLDGVEDPHNLGAILRSAEAAGARAVVVPARRSAHVTAAVVRASAGAALLLPTCVVPNLAEALRASRQAGFWLVGLDPAASEPLMPAPAGQPVGLVIGGEGPGLRRLVAERCDTLAHLPMRGSVGSLNASVAAAVGIYRLCQADLYR